MRWLAGTLLILLTFPLVSLAADPDWRAGRKIFKKCKACHSFKPGVHRFGPSLAGVFGRVAGAAADFDYSPGMRKKAVSGLVWRDDTLNIFLTKPSAFIAKTKMRFPGLPNSRDRRNVIAYVKRRAK